MLYRRFVASLEPRLAALEDQMRVLQRLSCTQERLGLGDNSCMRQIILPKSILTCCRLRWISRNEIHHGQRAKTKVQ